MTLDGQVHLRPATAGDLATCEAIWRDALNDYLIPLGQQEIPPDNPSLRQLHRHAFESDPGLFWVAARSGDGAEQIVGFASAVRRDDVWFLSMLFVRPAEQRSGIGRSLLARVLPSPVDGITLAVATDAAQPVSNGLYASFGMAPRIPLISLIGRPGRPGVLPPLPDGLTIDRMTPSAPAERDRALDAELADLDRAVVGFAHPEDHAFVRAQGRIGFTFRDGVGRLMGYGYTSELGRVGPVAVREAGLLAPVVAHLLEVVVPRGASAVWVPGSAGSMLELLVRAGLRIEGFPVLLCWNRPFADFSRYVPISPGLL